LEGSAGHEDETVNAETFQDVSLHSYKCTLCGAIFWYSERGRLAETTGRSVMDLTDEEWMLHEQ
jgi:hypothetical protein